MSPRFDFTDMLAKASTWLALLSTASGAALIAYAAMPERAQALFPDWTLAALGGLAVGSAFLVPVATSFKQRNLGRANQVEIVKKVTVEGDVSPAAAAHIAKAVNDGNAGEA